ncbi:hypothetical protein ACOSQ4_009207 [Xanthoceras sorbifolium]
MLQQPVNLSSLLHIPLPGRKIPEWFICRSDGNSVGIGLPPNWLNDEFMGIAMCGVISPDPEIWNDIWLVGCTMSIVSKDYTFRFCIPYFTSVESQHLWLAYASREKFEHERSDQLSNSTCIHARFGINTWVRNSNSKVIKCGIRPVYKKDTECLQESPPAEGSILHQSQNCSILTPNQSTALWMPTRFSELDKETNPFITDREQHSLVNQFDYVL